MGGVLVQLRQKGVEAIGQVHDWRGATSTLIPFERLLSVNEMTELPDAESSCVQQLLRIPIQICYVHQALTVGVPCTDRHTVAQSPSLEGKESDDLGSVEEDRDTGLCPEAADCDRELWGKEGIRKCPASPLDAAPPGQLRLTKIIGMNN